MQVNLPLARLFFWYSATSLLHKPLRSSVLRWLLSCSTRMRGSWSKHSFSLSLFFCLSLSLSLYSQSHPLGSWNILNTKLTIDPHWSVFAEGQMRSTEFMTDFFYYEVKGGVNYNVTKSFSFTAGAGHYASYTPGGNFEEPLLVGENRTWLQMAMEHQLGRITFDHRYRAEQRHLTTGYKNRFRYRLNMTVPINKPTISAGTLFGYIGDEIFFTNKSPYYERNRFFTGLGYKFSTLFTIQSGYMRQFDYKIEAQAYRHFLQVALLFNFKLKEHVDHSVPKITD